jgi:putative ABC transport system permease protein
MWSRLRWWLHAALRRSRMETEMTDEMRFHMEALADDLERDGLSRHEAMRLARLEFGGLDRAKEESREAQGVHVLDTIVQDVRYTARALGHSPAFAIVAVLTLALGIGASTAVFGVASAVLLKPLPYPDPEHIVMPELVAPAGVIIGSEYFPWGEKQFRMLTRDAHPFEAVGAFQSDSFALTGAGDPLFLDGIRTSAGLFPALRIAPAVGRVFTADEDRPGHEHVVVLGDWLWRERFGADPHIVGHVVRLNSDAYTVVGVMPPGFVFPRGEEMPGSFNFPRVAQLWVPLGMAEEPKGGPSELAVIGRLKPNLTIEHAQAAMDLVTKHAEARNSQWKGWFNTRVVPLTNQVVGDMRRPLELLLAAAGLVLLIACSNVANLLLARSVGRRREFALRGALGAGRRRIVRQVLTESIVIALLAGGLGLVIAEACIDLAKTFGPSNVPRLHEATLDLPVFAFALGVSLVVGIVFGLAPAIGATAGNIGAALQERGRGTPGSWTNRHFRSALLVSQVGLALVLIISSVLLTQTFFRMLGADVGFNPERVLTFQLSLPALKYGNDNRIVSLYRNVLDRLRSVPGVQAAGIGETIPMGGEGESTGIRIPDRPVAGDKELPFANYTIVSPGYLASIGAPILQGRDFADSDTGESVPVTIVNRTMERKYWPGQSAIGKQVGPASTRYPLATIVGVVPDVRHFSARENVAPEMYVLYNQRPWPSMLNMRVAVRTKADPAAMAESVREAVRSQDTDLPLAKIATLRTIVSESLSQPRFAMLLLGTFGVLALLLASVGMYSVISYSVSNRTGEIGIRLALGAERRSLFAMVLGEGFRLASLGIAIGLAAAFGVTRAMAGFLYGVRPADPLVFVTVSLFLVSVALLACFVPAWRASRVDPSIALRHD